MRARLLLLPVLYVATFCLIAAAWAAFGKLGDKTVALKLTSRSFENGGAIPKQFTCDGADASPMLEWTAGPANTKSYA